MVRIKVIKMKKKTTFAVFFGNRGFFPASLIAQARIDMAEVLESSGYGCLMLEESLTRYGAVETPREGEVYAKFLQDNRGKYDGIILCLPNFGDETGAISALRDCGVPIFVQAYPDELEKMAPELRRDAFCGKFSIMDVFTQYGVPFTAMKPHVVHPKSNQFNENLQRFAAICRVVNSMKRMTVGCIGARTTPFKTVRVDELALQQHGITVETVDMADVIGRVNKLDSAATDVINKINRLRGYTCWNGIPDEAVVNLAKLGVAIDNIIDELQLDAIAIRCWIELQEQLKVSPCVLLSELNDRGVIAACETDIASAVAMYALSQASLASSTCLDWNNNYGDDENKCIVFHCGPVPQQMMTGPGQVTDHAILANSVGCGCSYGCNTGRMKPSLVTVAGMLTDKGQLNFYLSEGELTDDPIPDNFFGCAGVLKIDDMQDTLQTLGYLGHRHHLTLTSGLYMDALYEAFTRYLNYTVTIV